MAEPSAELDKIFRNMTMEFVKQLKLELSTPRLHAPGFNGQAYSEGRNTKFRVSKPTSFPGGQGLHDSIAVEKVEGGYGITMADNWENVVTGMKPQKQYLSGKGSGGTSKFITALQKWAISRGINPSAAFGIRTNIWKYGIKPFNFIALAQDNVLSLLEDELEEDLLTYVEDVFSEVIKTPKRQY
tara:strand:+ start:4131 stop:4685 length:555 start_codon:yes stop_codon:yes gene_type:complete